MATDVLILNTAVVDFRSGQFEFTEALAGPGGLARCKTAQMPEYTQKQYKTWIDQGLAAAGGPGNTAPLIARTGIKVAVGVNLGRGDFGGLDAQGRRFYDVMQDNNVDMSAAYIHPNLPTGTTFIYEKGGTERGGIAYFPNANNDFDFEYFKKAVKRLKPRIVYYMYSGLSDRGDANGGKDLADFMGWCRDRGALTIADCHTLTGNPESLIRRDAAVDEYRLLEPLLPQLDMFFTSCDEARMIENTLAEKGNSKKLTQEEYIRHFLDFLTKISWKDAPRTRMFGVTVGDGAYEKHICKTGGSATAKITSAYMTGDVVDLVGAGDSFRAGLVSYVARDTGDFADGKIDFSRAVGMGNLFASLYIKAPLDNRYGNIASFDRMLNVVQDGKTYDSLEKLIAAIKC